MSSIQSVKNVFVETLYAKNDNVEDISIGKDSGLVFSTSVVLPGDYRLNIRADREDIQKTQIVLSEGGILKTSLIEKTRGKKEMEKLEETIQNACRSHQLRFRDGVISSNARSIKSVSRAINKICKVCKAISEEY